jgi:hypothetical protein
VAVRAGACYRVGREETGGVSVRRAQRLPRPRDELTELQENVARLRRRLGRERLLRLLVRGILLAAVAAAAVALGAWLLGLAALPWLLALAVVAPSAALMVAIARWPSPEAAARLADRRHRLDERLATALELAPGLRAGRAGPLDGLQVRDALAYARAIAGRPLASDGLAREAGLAALGLGVAVAALALVLLGARHPGWPYPGGAAPAGAPAALEPEPALPPVPAVAPPAVAPPPAAAPAPPASRPQPDPNLTQRLQQEQAQRAALDRLADALRQMSATRSAGEALARGDAASAGDQIASLGERADELSAAAKQQLAQALDTAASQTSQAGGDRALAQREQQAAQALSRNDYAAQQRALQQLGEQVKRSGTAAPSPDQLQRDQAQAAAQGGADSQSGGSQPGSGAASQGAQSGGGEAGGAAGAGQGQGIGQAAGDQAGGGVGASGGAEGGAGGPGAGQGAGAPISDSNPAPPLDATAQRVDVPVELGPGERTHPSTGAPNQPQAPLRGGGTGAVSESSQTQSTGSLAPERNLVPAEQRQVVRGYFNGNGGR